MGCMYIIGKVNKLHGDTVTLYTRNSKRNFKNGHLSAHGTFSVNKNVGSCNMENNLFCVQVIDTFE
jgi:hypothetical protein